MQYQPFTFCLFLPNNRILYADLEFVPEERFSMSARLLLQGMIKRDPATRMGAWENPPQDIMSAPFFGGIQWDAIYERRFDGPYVPEAQIFGSSKSKKGQESADHTEGQDSQGNDRPARTRREGEQSDDESGEDEEEGEEDNDSESELKGMRDSVFIRPHDAAGNNLLDWSFIDEKVLAETCAEGDPSKKNKKKKKKRTKRAAEGAAPVSAEGAAVDTTAAAEANNLLQEIETKQVGFAAPVPAAVPVAVAPPAAPDSLATAVANES